MHPIFTLAAFWVCQTTSQANLTSKDLPILPVDKKEFVYGNNLDFDLIPTDQGAFDPKELMPVISSAQDGKYSVSWTKTPVDIETTDKLILSVVGPGKLEPLYHRFEVIEYGKRTSQGFAVREFVLLYDYHVFCVAEGDSDNDPPEFHCGYNLVLKDHVLTIDVGQFESGTGAYNSHAVFEISAKGPKLVDLSSGGRTGK